MKLIRWKVLLLCAWTFCLTASAQDLDLIGSVAWEKTGSRIRIRAEQIENNRPEGTSGALRLQIWATLEPYDGVSAITGWVVATLKLKALPAGHAYANINRPVRYHAPPAGLYYTTMTLEEDLGGTGDDFVIVDSENFAGLVNFGGYGEGAAHYDAGNGDIGFVGDISWLAGNRRVELFAENIQNERASGRSGTLRIRLWATETRYEGGDFLQGFPMSTKGIGRIYAQSVISFSKRHTFRPPPPGEYFVTMTLEEFYFGWNIVDYVTFDGTSLF